jgi:hypothetical protein
MTLKKTNTGNITSAGFDSLLSSSTYFAPGGNIFSDLNHRRPSTDAFNTIKKRPAPTASVSSYPQPATAAAAAMNMAAMTSMTT